MEPLESVSKRAHLHIADEILEYAQCTTHFAGMVQVFDGIERFGVLNETDGTPKTILFIDEKVIFPGTHDTWHLPGMTLLLHTSMYVFGEGAHIFHDQARLFEDPGVNALQDEFVLLRCIKGNDVGIIDVAVAELLHVQDVPARLELFGYECEIFQKISPAI
jgi:hypothetical protein